MSTPMHRIAEQRAKECAKLAYDLILEGWKDIAEAMADSEASKAGVSVKFQFIGNMSSPVIKSCLNIPATIKHAAEDIQGANPDQLPLPLDQEPENG